MFYLLKRESNHTLKNSHTGTIVFIPAESRITRAVEESLCICTSGIVPTAVVGILSTFTNYSKRDKCGSKNPHFFCRETLRAGIELR